MSKTMKDPRQIGLRKFLEQIGNRAHHEGTADAKPANVSELDNLLDSINFELTQPLRMDASNPADLVLNIGPAIITNTENDRNRTIPHIGSLLPNNFASGTVTFPATSGNPIVVAPGNNGTLTVANNEYIKVLIYMDANGDLNVLPGTPNAVEADATVLPSPNNTLPVGYVTLFNNAGTIDNINQNSIYQFGTGAGGGSGTGDASSFIEMTRNRLDDSIFQAFTAYVAETDEDDDTIVDAGSTGAFNLVTSRYELNTGELILTTNLLDDEYLNDNTDLDKAELIVRYDEAGIDLAGTYELSKDGGSNWEPVIMEQVPDSDTFRGIVQFAPLAAGTPVSLQVFTDQASPSSELGVGSFERLAQDINITANTVITQFDAEINVSGSPVGTITPKLIREDTDFPSTNPSDVVWTGSPIAASSLSTGTFSVTVNSPTLMVGIYHMVFTGDATYNAAAGGGDRISFRRDSGVSFVGSSGITYFNGASWAGISGSMTHEVFGYEFTDLDLRARVTSSQNGSLIEGLAVLFDQGAGNVSDNLDQSYINSIILEENRLGSTNPLYDRSVAGEGILLRATNGTLIEASIEWNGFNYQWNFAEVPE